MDDCFSINLLLHHLFWIEFVNAYVLLSRNQPNKAISARDRLGYVLDHNNPTPGRTRTNSSSLCPTPSVLFRLHLSWPRWTGLEPFESILRVSFDTRDCCRDWPLFLFSNSGEGTTVPQTSTWEQHWTKLDDGTGRYVDIHLCSVFLHLSRLFSVPQEKFVEYVTTSDDYKTHLDRPLI